MAFDLSGTAYVLTTSGLSVIPIDSTAQVIPQLPANSVVNAANFQTSVAMGGLIPYRA
jgi:hypothetical protein